MNAQIADELGEPGVQLREQFSGNFFLHNNGWGFGFRYGKFKTVKRDFIYEFDFNRLKHPKEVKIANPNFNRPPSYVYGKLNNAFGLRFGVGQQKELFRKGEKNGVEVRYLASAGFSPVLLKPVYLLVFSPPNSEITEVIKYDPNVHYNEDIFGAADFSSGLNELKIRPGAYGKLGLVFEWGEFQEDVRTIEIGATVDVYAGRIPIMAFIENKSTFVSLYIAMSFGKRW